MKHFLYAITALCLLIACSDDEGQSDPNQDDIIGTYHFCFGGSDQEVVPSTYPVYLDGGTRGFLECVYNKTRYPALAKENGLEGEVILEVKIDSDGIVDAVHLVEDIGDGCGAAAQLALEECVLGQTFRPGSIMGEPATLCWQVPVKFRLE